VFRVRRGTTEYALKVLDTDTDTGDRNRALAGFRREAALLTTIHHPGLAGIHEVGETAGRPYLIMDLVEGEALSRRLADGALPAARAVRLGRDIADTLAAVHRAGLVHRDITPGNIILPPAGQARLIDFGLVARNVDSGDRSTVGTLAYAAAEQAGTLNRPVDGRSDLYSLGVVLYQCVTGQLPFEGDPATLLRMHATVPAPDPRTVVADVPEGLAAVILALLAKDPDDRYANADALLADLRRLEVAPDLALTPNTHPATGPRPRSLVGRGRELSRLRDRWVRAAAGTGGVVLLRGAAGVGKSRLAEELLTTAAASGALIMRGKCTPGDPLPLASIRYAIAAHVAAVKQLAPADRDAALARLAGAASAAGDLLADLHPQLATAHPAASPDPDTHGDQVQFTLAVAGFLADLARAHDGLLLHIDDLQWLDEGSRRVLTALTDLLPTVPLLLVGTARDDADSAAALEQISGRLGPALDLDITVRPLRDEDLAAVVADLLPGMRSDDRLVELLRGRAQGSPFLIGEYVRAITDAGLLRPSWGDWILDEDGLAELDLPGDALGLVLARMRGLGDLARTVLTTAAALGIRFHVEVVARVCGVTPEEAHTVVADACARSLLEARAGGQVFVHDRIREALLDDLDPAATAALHQRIAEVLDELRAVPADPDRGPGAIDPLGIFAVAAHYIRGVPGATPVAAFRACVEAGHAALAGHAAGEAARFLEHAAALGVYSADPDDHPGAGLRPAVDRELGVTESEFLQLLGSALQRDGRYAEAEQRLDAALAVVDPGDRLQRAAILGRMAEIQRASWQLDRVAVTADAGIAELGLWLPRNRIAFILSSVLLVLMSTAIRLTGLGLGTARGTTRERYRLGVSLHLTAAYACSMNLNLAMIPYQARTLYYAYRLGRGDELALSTAALGLLEVNAGLRRAGLRTLRRAERMVESMDDPRSVAAVGHYRALGALYGDEDTGELLARSITERGHLLDLGFFADGLSMLAWPATIDGRLGEALGWLQLGRRRLAAAGDHDLCAIVHSSAYYDAAIGRSADAAAELNRVEALLPDDRSGLAMMVSGTKLFTLLEQGEYGSTLDEAIARHRPLHMPLVSLPTPAQTTFVHAAFARLGQARIADSAQRPARIAAAERALRALRRIGKGPVPRAYQPILGADLELLRGRPERALALLDGLRPVRPDSPMIAYEAARVRARAYAALGESAESRRHAQLAMLLADEYGWPHRVRWITTEFGVTRAGIGGTTSGMAATIVRPVATNAGMPTEVDRQRLQAVEEIGRLATTTLDPDELAIATLDATIRILSAERAFLFLTPVEADQGAADSDTAGEAVLVAHIGRDAAGNTVEPTRYSASLVDRVASTRETLVVAGTEEGAALGAQSVVMHNLRSVMVAPLQLDGRLLGVVYLDSSIAKGLFTADDAGILAALTNHIATTLQTARAAHLEATVHAARQQQLLAEALRAALAAMTSTLEPDEVLTQLLDAATGMLPCDNAWLVVRSEKDSATLHGRVAVDGEPRRYLPGPSGPISSGPDFADRLSRGFALMTGDVDAADTLPGELSGLVGSAASWVGIPLGARTTQVGLLLLSSATPGCYQQAELAVASALVAQAMAAYENAILFAKVQSLAVADELTGIANRRQFFNLAERQLSMIAGGLRAAIMIDIDHFKRINDTYGHPTGDDVIRTVAARLAASIRGSDVLGRYGGEEFAVLLEQCNDAEAAAERLRAAIADVPVDTRSGPLAVTVSIGLIGQRSFDDDVTTLLAGADQALYQAKQDGRNRVRVA
jgi:diguanylate cyclase (GGDEF)-like protein